VGIHQALPSDGTIYTPPPAPTPSPPPKPAVVSFIAFPGGKVFVDGRLLGSDSTGKVTLKPGMYTVRVENRFLGEYETTVEVTEGQTGTVTITW
jgi:hypothetical protein